MDEGVNRGLLHAWVAARSIARGMPAPVSDHGGWRVDTRSPTEICRWIYDAPDGAIRDLARAHGEPGYQIKVCGYVETLAALVPGDWTVEATGWFMIGPDVPIPAVLPAGYSAELQRNGAQVEVRIAAADGSLAASGYSGECATGFAYDRIVTEPDHRRKGLGRVVMARLAAGKSNRALPDLLVATEMGRALYESLGWLAISPYTTAYSPGSVQ